jgi:hypothetical protein
MKFNPLEDTLVEVVLENNSRMIPIIFHTKNKEEIEKKLKNKYKDYYIFKNYEINFNELIGIVLENNYYKN